MVLGSVLGPIGIAGAWLRLASTEATLRIKPRRRYWVLAMLAAGILGSLILIALFWTFFETRFASVVFVHAALLGAILMWVSVPVRPNTTVA